MAASDKHNGRDVTVMLNAVREREPGAADALMLLVYRELRQIAASKMAREQPGQTLQATALVHEAWLRLGDGEFQNRAHFFSAASEAMRRILVDTARRKKASKHGAGAEHVELDDV